MPGCDVAILLPSLAGGGAEHVVLDLLEAFTARGVRCELVVLKREGPLLSRVPKEVPLIALEAEGLLSTVLRTVGYLRRKKPRALLSTIQKPNVIAVLATRFVRTRCVIREAIATSIEVRRPTWLATTMQRMAIRFAYPRADAVIALSPDIAEDLAANFGVRRDRLVTIANPCDFPEVVRNERPGDGKLIIACGRLEPQKDFASLIRAFALVRGRMASSLKLVILGEGSQRAALRQLAAELRVEDAVELRGFVPDPQRHMAEASLFVHCSLFEGFPNVIAQALAAGCQVVATDCPGATRLLLDSGRYGTLVRPGDVEGLADAMHAVLTGAVRHDSAQAHLAQFATKPIVDRYLETLLPGSKP